MNGLGMTITGIGVAGILFGSRRWALLSATGGILYLTIAQGIVIAGFSVYAFRILSVALFLRALCRKELPRALQPMDRMVLAAYACFVIVFLLRVQPDEGGHAYQIGVAVDAFLWYFGLRSLVRSIDDLSWLLRGLVFLLAPYAGLVVIETVTTQNPFALIGGVELAHAGDTWFRDERLRALGSFGHPSLLGTVAATFLALYVALWVAGISRAMTAAGVILCLVIVWATNSGGPQGCVGFVIVGWFTWYLRRHMRAVRISLVLTLLVTAMAMTAPIWYLLAKISALTGGDGFHRAALLDIAFQNLDKWWLAGMPTIETSAWLPYTNTVTGGVDMTNNFLVFGVSSGLATMGLLIALVVQTFKSIGRSLWAARDAGLTTQELVLWGIGVMHATHVFNWFSITYWDQSNLIWLLHLAIAGSLAQSTSEPLASPAGRLVDAQPSSLQHR